MAIHLALNGEGIVGLTKRGSLTCMPLDYMGSLAKNSLQDLTRSAVLFDVMARREGRQSRQGRTRLRARRRRGCGSYK